MLLNIFKFGVALGGIIEMIENWLGHWELVLPSCVAVPSQSQHSGLPRRHDTGGLLGSRIYMLLLAPVLSPYFPFSPPLARILKSSNENESEKQPNVCLLLERYFWASACSGWHSQNSSVLATSNAFVLELVKAVLHA